MLWTMPLFNIICDMWLPIMTQWSFSSLPPYGMFIVFTLQVRSVPLFVFSTHVGTTVHEILRHFMSVPQDLRRVFIWLFNVQNTSQASQAFSHQQYHHRILHGISHWRWSRLAATFAWEHPAPWLPQCHWNFFKVSEFGWFNQIVYQRSSFLGWKVKGCENKPKE